jgi:hypothetical protein
VIPDALGSLAAELDKAKAGDAIVIAANAAPARIDTFTLQTPMEVNSFGRFNT